MSYHAIGTMEIVNDDGKKYTYKVETFGGSLILSGVDGQWHYISDTPPVLIERLHKDIEDLKDQLMDKENILTQLKEAL